jgi:hypothetical protein
VCMMASLYSPLWSMLCWRATSPKSHISLPSVLQIRNSLPPDHSSPHTRTIDATAVDSLSLCTRNPTMSRHPSTHPRRSMRPVENPLTEANLRLHSLACHQVCKICPACFDMRTDFKEQTYSDDKFNLSEGQPRTFLLNSPRHLGGDFDESEDESIEAAQLSIALRKAASLEALQAYGGCFVSGFLAMQEPLPWSPPTNTSKATNQRMYQSGIAETSLTRKHSLETATITSYDSNDSPRPDSDTLSVADVRELESRRRWRRICLGRRVTATNSKARH